jgi:phenylalanyl-tRNA synthetase alpha chain
MDYLQKIKKAQTIEQLEAIKQELFGKKGYFPKQFEELKNIPKEQKKQFAIRINQQKQEASLALEQKKNELLELMLTKKLQSEQLDFSLLNHSLIKLFGRLLLPWKSLILRKGISLGICVP